MDEGAAVLVVLAVMYGIARGSWPWLAVNRAGITVIGAALLIALGTITPTAAWQAIDLPTLVILAGMMVIAHTLEEAGLFRVAAEYIGQRIGHGVSLLAVLMVCCAVLSAVFLNDTVVFLFTPFVLLLVQDLGIAALPFLLGIALSANIGSALTITGNPQNIIIGAASGIGFLPFARAMLPVVTVSLLVAFCSLWLVFRTQLTTIAVQPASRVHRMHPRGWLTMALLTVLLLSGVPSAAAVFCTAASTLIRRTPTTRPVWARIDSELLIFFAALFIVTGAFGKTQHAQVVMTYAIDSIHGMLPRLGIATAVLSNVVSNVPAVLLLRPVVASFAQPADAWMLLAASATFAGNTTLLASVANLIVVERAQHAGITINFWEFARVGFPITVVSLALTMWWFAG